MTRRIFSAVLFAQLLLSPYRADAQRVKAINDYIPCQLTPRQDEAMRSKPPEAILSAEITRQSNLGRIAKPAEFVAALQSTSNFDEAFKRAAPYLNDGQDTSDAVENAIKGPFEQTRKTAVQRPTDIACSQSLLAWEEASDIFGRRIANTYLVFQVIVRNLNQDNDFVMQDVKIALDSPYSHFVAGRDKMLARGVAMRGQSDDPRNVWMRVGDAAASVAGAASVAFTGVDFKNGVSIFTSAFLPGMKNVFPDYTIDQLNRLNDLGFTSSSASKIVIAKGGSAPFVTFLPAKIFASAGTNKPVPYKNWTQPQLLAFSNSAYVILAGAHVKEVDEQPSITKVTCPVDTAGALDLSKAVGGTFTCDVTGSNLDNSIELRLKNAKESNDKVVADATLTINGKDNTTGKVAFKLSDLKALKATEYAVYLVQDTTNETATSLTVTLKQ